jgi:hypothetical protein
MKQLGSHCTHICENLCWWCGMLLNSVVKIQNWLMGSSYESLDMCMTGLVNALPWVMCVAVDIKLHYFFMQLSSTVKPTRCTFSIHFIMY